MAVPVYGRDRSLLSMVGDVTGRTGPEAVTEFRRRMRMFHTARRRGVVSYVGKVKYLSLRDLVNDSVVEAVRTEMHRRRIGDLCGTRLEDDLVDAAVSCLIDRHPQYDVRTPEDAARCVVRETIESGRHTEMRQSMSLDDLIGSAVRHRW